MDKEQQIQELLNFDSLCLRYQEVLPGYKFFQDANEEGLISLNYDGVPYSFSHTLYTSEPNLEELLTEQINSYITQFKLSIEREHHELIKEIYELSRTLYSDKIFVKLGGGHNIEVFYNNSKECFGTLALSSISQKIDTPEEFYFSVQFKRNDKYFINNFDIKGVKLVTHEEVWGEYDRKAREIKSTGITPIGPVEMINLIINNFGYLDNIKDNPYSLLLHIFYSFGHGYKLLEHDGIVYVYFDDLDQIQTIAPLAKSKKLDIEKTEDMINLLKEEMELDDFQGNEDERKSTERLIKILSNNVNSYKSITAAKENSKSFKINTLSDLDNYEFDQNNIYWEHLTGMVSGYSIVANLPDNLCEKWKEAFNIVTTKMNEIDSQRVSKALERADI